MTNTRPSVCIACAHEQACGQAEFKACSNRLPISTLGCSCNSLREAIAERDMYRNKALFWACRGQSPDGCTGCPHNDDPNLWCLTVLEEVDGCAS